MYEAVLIGDILSEPHNYFPVQNCYYVAKCCVCLHGKPYCYKQGLIVHTIIL